MNRQAGMQLGTAPLLKRHRVFHSHDAEETRAFLGGKGYKFDLSPRQARQLNTGINAFYMPGMYLGYMHYGSLPVELSPSVARSDFLLQLPVRGHLAASMGGESVESNPSRAVIVSPVRGCGCVVSLQTAGFSSSQPSRYPRPAPMLKFSGAPSGVILNPVLPAGTSSLPGEPPSVSTVSISRRSR